MNRSHQAIKATTWNYLSRLSDVGFLFLINALIARTLGPAQDSIYTLFLTIVGTTVTFTSVGIDWIIYKYFPQLKAQNKSNEAAALLRRTFIIRFSIACVGAITIYFLIVSSGAGVLASYAVLIPFGGCAALYIVGQNIANYGTVALTAGLRTKEALFINGSVKFFLITALGICVFQSYLTPSIAIISVTAAAVLTGVLHTGSLLPRIRGPRAAIVYSPIIMFGVFLLGNDILSFLLGRASDILILRYWFPGSPIISIYDKAFQAGLVVEYFVTIGLSGVLFSVFAELATRARSELGEAFQRTLAMIQFAFIPVAIFVVYYAPVLVVSLYGSQYAPAADLLRAFLLMDIIDMGVFGGGLNITLLNVINAERIVLINRCIWGAINLGVNLYAIPHYGVFAAIITTRACNLCAGGVEHFIARRAIGAGYQFRWLGIAAGAALAGIAGIFFLPGESLSNCAIGGLVFLLICGCVYYFLKPAPMMWAYQIIRQKYAHEASQ